MSKVMQPNPKLFRDSRVVESFAKQKNLTIKNGGEHKKIYAPEDSEYSGEHVALPNHKELSNGVSRSIVKTFLRWGLFVILFAVGFSALSLMILFGLGIL